MRYYADGDLTEGLQIAHKPFPVDQLEGDWHIVWASIDGSTQTINYDEPGNLSLMGLTLQIVEPSDKRKKATGINLQLNLNFCKWGLEFQGEYNAISPATKLDLVANTTSELVDADDEAVLVFGLVTDDEGYPFLRLATAASPLSSGLDHLQNLEFVAKKTDTTGIHCLELTKNEKLRLGYPVRADGTFEDQGPEPLGESTDVLTRQLREHADAQAQIIQKLSIIREQIDKQLLDMPRLPSMNGPPPKPAVQPQIQHRARAIGSTSKAPATVASTSVTAVETLTPEDQLIEAAGGPRVSSSASASPPSPSRHSTSSSRTSSWNFGAATEGGVKKKVCRVCDKSISAANWAVHEKSRKHQLNAQEDLAANGPVPAVAEQGGGGKRQKTGMRLSGRGSLGRSTATGMMLRGNVPDTPNSL